jgi:RNA polymerase sigma factor (sigma-70 family)
MSAGAVHQTAMGRMTARASRLRSHTVHQRLSSECVAELVSAASAGDRQAWNGLVREFGGMIWAIARGYRLRESDAADVSQATWLRLLEHLDRLNDPACVGAWLATTARRECLRILREGERRLPLADDAAEGECSDMPPGEALLITERDGALWKGFSRLRESDQALLRLLMTDPRPPYEEIAAALDIPIGSIGPTRQRALQRLRQELESCGTLTLMVD